MTRSSWARTCAAYPSQAASKCSTTSEFAATNSRASVLVSARKSEGTIGCTRTYPNRQASAVNGTARPASAARPPYPRTRVERERRRSWTDHGSSRSNVTRPLNRQTKAQSRRSIANGFAARKPNPSAHPCPANREALDQAEPRLRLGRPPRCEATQPPKAATPSEARR